MINDLHHVIVFVTNMDRVVHLFQDVLGFQLLWRVERADVSQAAAALGTAEVDSAYLQARPGGVAVELLRRISPALDNNAVRYDAPGTSSPNWILSLMVQDLEGLYQRLIEEGWTSLLPITPIQLPTGESCRICFFYVGEGLTLELAGEGVAK